MADKSAIEWTDATWNPVVGCEPPITASGERSPGCTFCYARVLHDRRYFAWKRGTFPTAPQQYHQPFQHVQLLPDRLDPPWARSSLSKPRRVFVNSMSDLFHDQVPDDFIKRMFHKMADPWGIRHTYQILTKRPERMQALLSSEEFRSTFWSGNYGPFTLSESYGQPGHHWKAGQWPLPNVWLGVSAEDQQRADERIPLLLQTPAAVRFVSLEPLLGPIDLTEIEAGPECFFDALCPVFADDDARLDWVIVGGESGGPKERSLLDSMTYTNSLQRRETCLLPSMFKEHWVRSLRDQCVAAGVPFLMKQWGGPTPKSGGRLLDGVIWSQFPDGLGGIVDA